MRIKKVDFHKEASRERHEFMKSLIEDIISVQPMGDSLEKFAGVLAENPSSTLIVDPVGSTKDFLCSKKDTES